MKNLLVIYGEGGHASEAKNFISEMSKFSDVNIFTCGSLSDVDFNINDVRDKYSNLSLIKGLLGNVMKFNSLLKFYRTSNITHVVSFGPGISIIPILIGKCLSIKTAHIETSCRFESKSLTGKLLYFVVDSFYVQNKELLSLYKNAIFVGRL